jgi:hypothetical protein
MKRIINGQSYDTETAERIAHGDPPHRLVALARLRQVKAGLLSAKERQLA